MNKKIILFTFIVLVFIGAVVTRVISKGKMSEREKRNLIDTRIDNIHYWVEKAKQGIIPFNPQVKADPAVFTGSKLNAFGIITEDSPDVPVTDNPGVTESETSVFVNPNDSDNPLNSNNSTNNPVTTLYGANDFYSFDGGETWEGEETGAGGSNYGDPATAISNNGRYFINYISIQGGQGISYSDDQGQTWTAKTVYTAVSGELADKNHMWIDNSTDSPYEGNLYVAWTDFNGPHATQIVVSRSTTNGESWETEQEISSAVNAGHFNQGVNLSSGPDGEVYAVWAIYDSWPSDETALGMARSLDGGVTWEPAVRIIENIRGIRYTGVSKNMRVASWPAATVDVSNGPNRGTIYVVWSNVGLPGHNTGNDIDVYMIRSTDKGLTWSEPVRVNQDEWAFGKEHYDPWITCDPSNGIISVIFYDDRNVSSSQCEVYCDVSFDGGNTWEDFKVSDVAFTPRPIPGLAGGYFGDYIGITAQDGIVYPVWTDNRTGSAMAYVSPFKINLLSRPYNLTGDVVFETGAANLVWNWDDAPNFTHFNIYRDGNIVGTSDDTVYTDMLPDYGYYTYFVTAAYSDSTGEKESSAETLGLQWGGAHISVVPDSVFATLIVDSSETKFIRVVNTGQLALFYNVAVIEKSKNRETESYCSAMGGNGEYISRVQIGDIDNASGANYYKDYTNLSTTVKMGESYLLTVTNGNPYDQDRCGVWIDWNRNEIFDEPMIPVSGNPGYGPYTAIISPPLGSKTGPARMRIRICFDGEPFPCGNTRYGEVEDYTLNVVSWMDMNPVQDSIIPGDTSFIAVQFNSHNLEPGMYEAEVKFSSNDPDREIVNVPVSLEVRRVLVFAQTDKKEICLGDSAVISAQVFGTADTAIYSWTSNPEGLVSDTLAPITVKPDTTTWYFISISDTNGVLATDSVRITVNYPPQVSLPADTSLCGSGFLELDAGNEGSSYLWSNGDTTQTVIADTTGYGYGFQTWWVEVTTGKGCSASDTVTIEFVDCTGIEQYGSETVSLFPNPANGKVWLELPLSGNHVVNIKVMNTNGKTVYSLHKVELRERQSVLLNLSGLSGGVYYVIMETASNTLFRKLIIKK